MPLDHDAALSLAGGDVTGLAEAQNVEKVTPEHVAAAEQAAAEAERKAQESETAAVLGELPPMQAAADRETARFTRLRAAVTARRAERHRQAERLRALAQCGTDALSHAEGLAALRAATLADLAAIADLRARIASRITAWNDGLAGIAARGTALDPEPVPPSGVPLASSAGVWCGTIDTRPSVVTEGRAITGIDLEDRLDKGLPVLIERASRATRKHDPSARLYVGENGLVQPVGNDPGGHIARRIREGRARELTLAERKNYLAGKEISHA